MLVSTNPLGVSAAAMATATAFRLTTGGVAKRGPVGGVGRRGAAWPTGWVLTWLAIATAGAARDMAVVSSGIVATKFEREERKERENACGEEKKERVTGKRRGSQLEVEGETVKGKEQFELCKQKVRKSCALIKDFKERSQYLDRPTTRALSIKTVLLR